ncbi:MAG: 8-oxo-dGTP diphosphatase [Lachnospiraceae bacterium]|nr:8-oxo-dGTP diphosphatase [Lachnospiraceae bacterium]
MKNTTLCYLEQKDSYLMLLRNRKEHDENAGKWIGVGGKFEEGESPVDCLLREVREETGLTLTEYAFRGIVTFVSESWGTEQMFLFTATGFTGRLVTDCPEGELRWIPKGELADLPLWEGDRVFLELLAKDAPPFLLTLGYDGADRLIRNEIQWCPFSCPPPDA